MAARRPCDTSPSLEQTADLMPPLCCICAPDADHTMFRIKDAKVSLKFYTEILGMELGASVSESIDVETEPQLIRCSCISVQSTSRMAATLPSRSKLHGLALTREMHDDLLLILIRCQLPAHPPPSPLSLDLSLAATSSHSLRRARSTFRPRRKPTASSCERVSSSCATT